MKRGTLIGAQVVLMLWLLTLAVLVAPEEWRWVPLLAGSWMYFIGLMVEAVARVVARVMAGKADFNPDG